MKDLKHIHYFEQLLNINNNELVQQSIADGNIALGYSCFYAPEVLLNLSGSFGVRLRAPNTGSTQLGTYYLSNYTCGMTRALVERGLENGFQFLSGICGTETCAQMNRALEHFKLIKLVDNENFFLEFLDIPLTVSEHGYEYFAKQIKKLLLKPMNEKYGIDISNEAILKAVEQKNELNALMREIEVMRKKTDAVYITGTEMHMLNLVVKSCPIDLILPYIKETLEELKERTPEPNSSYRARVGLIGSELDDYRFTELMEQCGALVVADRYCFGTLPGYEHIEIVDEDPILSIAKHYLDISLCPRYMSKEKKDQRRAISKYFMEEYHTEGIIFETLKFCDYWGYEKTVAQEINVNEWDIPSVSIELNYTVSASGQLKTRVQAFVENLEIKRIAKNKKV